MAKSKSKTSRGPDNPAGNAKRRTRTGSRLATDTGLTPKQARFVEEYLIDLNGGQAAVRAGYTEKSRDVTASVLLSNAKVAAAIREAMAARSKRTEVTQDRVLSELAKIGFSDLRRAVKWKPCVIDNIPTNKVELVDSEELDDDTAAAIAEVSQTAHGVKIKFHDKSRALEQMGRHLGMFTDKVEHSVSGELAAMLKRRRERARNRDAGGQ